MNPNGKQYYTNNKTLYTNTWTQQRTMICVYAGVYILYKFCYYRWAAPKERKKTKKRSEN